MNLLPRLFIGLEAKAPWPESYPEGRLIKEDFLHMTLLFLGQTELKKVIALLESLKTWELAKGGLLDKVLFLPSEEKPRVCAYHVDLEEESEVIFEFQKELQTLFKKEGEFLPHVTLARAPKKLSEWEKIPRDLPVIFPSLHVYESLGQSTFKKLWSKKFVLSFEELSHTADMAYIIRGKDYKELLKYAEMALAFEFLPFVNKRKKDKSKISSIEDVIKSLNQSLSLVDIEYGAPFKAISFHGKVEQVDELLKWEMIIDV